jgi:hypothetical protein
VSLKELLLKQARTVATKKVRVGEVEVTVREMNVTTFERYMEAGRKKDRELANSILISESVVDENGSTVMTVDEARSLATSVRLSLNIISAVLEMSGVTEEEDEKHPVAS